jgi:hypothetical protein
MPQYVVRKCEKPSEKWGVFIDGSSTLISEFDTPQAARDGLKKLLEKIKESFDSFMRWIDGTGCKQEEITESSHHFGPVVQLDDFHAVQKTGRDKYAIHRIDDLNLVPAKDDPAMTIRYKDGKGTVTVREVDFGVGR